MEISRKSCRLCLTETDFNVSLHSGYCRKTNITDKILVCLKIVIEDTDVLNTICFKCASNVEKFYDFITFVKKSQTKLGSFESRRSISIEGSPTNHVNRRVTSYVREQVIDADYTFSFLEVPEEKKEPQPSSPFFSYFSPPNVLQKGNDTLWKTPRTLTDVKKEKREDKYRAPFKPTSKSRHHSRDLFESQSQDVDEGEQKSLDWKLTPDENLIKRVREKCFGRSDF